jgi:hypothetical protein
LAEVSALGASPWHRQLPSGQQLPVAGGGVAPSGAALPASPGLIGGVTEPSKAVLASGATDASEPKGGVFQGGATVLPSSAGGIPASLPGATTDGQLASASDDASSSASSQAATKSASAQDAAKAMERMVSPRT